MKLKFTPKIPLDKDIYVRTYHFCQVIPVYFSDKKQFFLMSPEFKMNLLINYFLLGDYL